MPKKSKYELIQSRFFRWRIMTNQFLVWYADGRSNHLNLGRHSLGTKSKDEAIQLLHQLDAVMAVRHGLADASILGEEDEEQLTLAEGVRLYLKYVGRPEVAGGASPKTVKRYKPIFQKFSEYAIEEGVESWDRVTKRLCEGYASRLESQQYAYRTQYIELTTIKQAMRWLVDEDLVPRRCLLKMQLNKPQGSPTYCYEPKEVSAIISHCVSDKELRWLGGVVSVLAYTGMRVGELAQLEGRDIDLESCVIHVRDESRGAARQGDADQRTTKSRRSRAIPIHNDLKRVFKSIKIQEKSKVFRGPLGGKLKPDTVRNVLIRDVLPAVAKQLYPKVKSPSILSGRVHSFRHTFCTLAYRAGWPERKILDLMGHTDSNITRLYRHMAFDEFRNAMDKFESLDESPEDNV